MLNEKRKTDRASQSENNGLRYYYEYNYNMNGIVSFGTFFFASVIDAFAIFSRILYVLAFIKNGP